MYPVHRDLLYMLHRSNEKQMYDANYFTKNIFHSKQLITIIYNIKYLESVQLVQVSLDQ